MRHKLRVSYSIRITASGLNLAVPGVVAAVAGRVPVLMDGGIRRGTDVFKALALGAKAVLLGRPVLYGLAVGGPQGVTRVLDILRNELEMAMALSGCRTLQDIGHQHLLQLPGAVLSPVTLPKSTADPVSGLTRNMCSGSNSGITSLDAASGREEDCYVGTGIVRKQVPDAAESHHRADFTVRCRL